MSNLFVSYMNADADIARRLEQRLLEKGHQVRIPVGAAVSGLWRTKYTKGLAASDVFLAVLSDSGLTSKNVLGEIGAARVMDHMRGMLVLPVLVGEMPIPDFISDLYCFRLKSNDDAEFARLVEELDKAIVDNVRSAPRIFISHRHIDEPIAAALVDLLDQAFDIKKNDIRCTSVKPYMLSPGERTSEQLRFDIGHSELVIGILSPDTSESNYVLCELGASWGRDIPTFPVLTRGATFTDVPPPLNERHSISLEIEDNCLDLVEFVASKTSLKRKDSMMGKLAQHAKALTNAARLARSTNAKMPSLIAGFMGGEPVRGRDDRYRIRLGVAGCPNETMQVVFCAHDEGLLTGAQPLENELCQVVRTNPTKSVVWAPEDEFWSVSGDCTFFAIGMRGDGYFATCAGLCDAIKNWYAFSGRGSVPEDVQEAIDYLIENDGTKLQPKKWRSRRQ